MLKAFLGPTVVAAMMATSLSAHAFTLTNQDTVEHMFTILVGDDEWDVTIEPNETLIHLCPSGCLIAIGYHREEDFSGNEVAKIIGGRLRVGE